MAGLRGQLPHQQLLLPDGPGGAKPLEARRRQEAQPAKGEAVDSIQVMVSRYLMFTPFQIRFFTHVVMPISLCQVIIKKSTPPLLAPKIEVDSSAEAAAGSSSPQQTVKIVKVMIMK